MRISLFIASIFILLSSCSLSRVKPLNKSVDNVKKDLVFEASAAPEWTKLMERDEGWFGADGIFSVPLDGNEAQNNSNAKTLFIFSDTYIGKVVDGAPLPGNVMVNNSTAWMTGLKPEEEKISFQFNVNGNGHPISYFVPENEQSMEGEYYWLGDAFVNPDKEGALYIFAYHVHKTGPNVFDFAQTNITLLKISDASKEGIKQYTQLPTDLGFVNKEGKRVYFGSGIYANTVWAGAPDPDGYIYVYGIIEGSKSLLAARFLPDQIENLDSWRFWNDGQWKEGKENAKAITDGISNELSLSPTGDGRYLLTFTILGLSDKVGIRVGESPVGPFGPIHEVYTCPEYAEKGLFTYNAKAHYHLSQPGKLLVSYNTITLDFWEDIQKDASIYHPRFIWVKY